ncbi:MAG: DUF983 domain-containing protein [Gemmatimonadaceae bacterium]
MVERNPEDIERPFAAGPMRRMVTMVGRALMLRCPNCGSRGLMKNWFKMEARCPACGLRVEREGNDYMAGSVMFNLVLAELVFAFVLVAWLVVQWPDVNWDALEIVAPLGMAAAPFVLFPFSKLVWLAADLALRPAAASELGVKQPSTISVK